MSAAEVDTAYSHMCRNLVNEKNELAKAYANAGNAAQKENVLVKARELFAKTMSDSHMDAFFSAFAIALKKFAEFNGCDKIVVEKTFPAKIKSALKGFLK